MVNKRIVIAGVFFVFLFSVVQPADVQFLNIQLLQQITEQVRVIQEQIQRLRTLLEAARERDLSRGMRGTDVETLQRFLRQFPDLYPEGLVTGYFGPFTEAAVKRFQSKYNLSLTGVVNAATRSKMANIIPPGLMITPEVQQVATSPPTTYKLQSKPVYDISRFERTIHDLVNKERQAAGLSLLEWDSEVAAVARGHSQDQARDNLELTDPNSLCHYPLIRHEGFSFDFTLRDRLQGQNIFFRSAGENIAMIAQTKNLTYQYRPDNPPPSCPEVAGYQPEKGLEGQQTVLYLEALDRMLEAVRLVKNYGPVEWLNREWRAEDEIAVKAVEGWMNSSGHRRNILRSEFNLSGVGAVTVNDYFIITHVLLGR